eukprot:3831931-Rhodomonas_salina.1
MSAPLVTPFPQSQQVFEKAKAKRAAEQAALPEDPIKVTLPDGNVKEGVRGKTSPYDIAMGISKGLAENAVVATVDGKPWDLKRPLEGERGCPVSLLCVCVCFCEGEVCFLLAAVHAS